MGQLGMAVCAALELWCHTLVQAPLQSHCVLLGKLGLCMEIVVQNELIQFMTFGVIHNGLTRAKL